MARQLCDGPNVGHATAEANQFQAIPLQNGRARTSETEKQREERLTVAYKKTIGISEVPMAQESQQKILQHLLTSGIMTAEEIGKIQTAQGPGIYKSECVWLITMLRNNGRLKPEFQAYKSRPRSIDIRSHILWLHMPQLVNLLMDPTTKEEFIKECGNRPKKVNQGKHQDSTESNDNSAVMYPDDPVPVKSNEDAMDLLRSTGIYVHRETGMPPLMILGPINGSCGASSTLEQHIDDFDLWNPELLPAPNAIWARDVLESYQDDITTPLHDVDRQFLYQTISDIING